MAGNAPAASRVSDPRVSDSRVSEPRTSVSGPAGAFESLLAILLPQEAQEKHASLPVPVVTVATSHALPFRLRFALANNDARDPDNEDPDKALPIAVPLALVEDAASGPEPPAPAKPAEAPEIPFTPPAVRAEAGSLKPAELAFAAKLTPKTAPVRTAEPVHREEAPEAPIVPRIVEKIEAIALPEAFSPPVQDAPPVERKNEIRETPRPILEAPHELTAVKPIESLRDISLKLTDSKQEHVEVRLVERSGELHISVRSADTHLNTELRNTLGDLAGNLEKTGFHAETWHPQEPAQPGNSKQQQQPDQHPERRNPRHPRRSMPKWVEEIGNNISTGDVHQ